MKMGITERGDAGIDFSWAEKLNTVDGAIVITKNVNKKFRELVLKNKDKLIVHVTCTGYGGTKIEPNVPEYKQQIQNMKALIDEGFPVEKVVLRVDPIIPNDSGMKIAEMVISETKKEISGLKRVRFSLIDMYPHVRERFRKSDIELPYAENFAPGKEEIEKINHWIVKMQEKYDVHFEACAEKTVAESIGCVSKRDIELLGLTFEESKWGYQRKGCLCLGCKTELLTERKQCPHQCLYCYWKG